MSKDRLILHLESAEKRWEGASPEERLSQISRFTSSLGQEILPRLRFMSLPEVLQLVLGMLDMSVEQLEELAVTEGYLDFDSRTFLNRDTVILAIAGSINRGSTATETSAYRRTGSTRWSRQDDEERGSRDE